MEAALLAYADNIVSVCNDANRTRRDVKAEDRPICRIGMIHQEESLENNRVTGMIAWRALTAVRIWWKSIDDI